MTDLEKSTFQNKPCYRYIRESDKLPTYDQLTSSPVAKVKLFNPTGSGTWYIAAYDPETRVAYGVADLGYDPEAGDLYMPELVEFRGRFGLPLERDLYWTPTPLKNLTQ